MIPRVLCALLVLGGMTIASAAVQVEGDLPRQADLGFRAGSSGDDLIVRQLAPDSPAQTAGLREGDRLLRINGQNFDKPYQAEAALEKLDGDQLLSLLIESDGTERSIEFTPLAKPLETIESLDTYYGVVETPDGARLRTIITRPTGTSGPLPAIFFVQWVSCDSVEFTQQGAWIDVFRMVAQRSGMALARVERSANGDSEGPPCHELDLQTELAHYRFAFDRLALSPHVDSSRIVILGNSLGSMLVPLVAQGRDVAGAAITSGGGMTYYERMLHFDRMHLERGGGAPADLYDKLMAQARFHVEYLLNGRTPEEIAASDPELGAVWGQIPHVGDGVHYGRPYAYHHQAAQLNLLGAWAAIETPVLVVYNEFDQYESRRSAEVVVETVNRLRPGSARLVVLPMLDHSFYLHATADAAFRGDGGVAAPAPAVQAILDWLDQEVLDGTLNPHKTAP
jgi:pimeloyl-ACP methyl ester carboxylesterase